MKRYELISLTLKDNKTNEIKEVLYDELDIINLFNKLDTQWQKLKEWLEEREKKHKLILRPSAFEDIEILNKMRELEAEDVED